MLADDLVANPSTPGMPRIPTAYNGPARHQHLRHQPIPVALDRAAQRSISGVMFLLAAATSPNAVSRVIWDAAYDTAAAVDSAEPNNAFSHAANTVSPARSSIHDRAGSAALIG